MHLANSFIADATRTNHPWFRVLSKKEKCTYADVAKPNPPLSGSNAIPLGSSQAHKRSSAFGRLNSLDLLRNLTDSASGSKVWRPVRSSIPAHGVLPAKNPEIAMNKESRAKSPGGLNLNLSLNLGSDSDPPQAHHSSARSPLLVNNQNLGRLQCSRYLSHKHSRPMCASSVRCLACLGLVMLPFIAGSRLGSRDCVYQRGALPSLRLLQLIFQPLLAGSLMIRP